MSVVAAVTCARPAEALITKSKSFNVHTCTLYLFVRGHRPKRVRVNSFYFSLCSHFAIRCPLYAQQSHTTAWNMCKGKRVPVLLTSTQNNGSNASETKNKLWQQKTTIEKVLPSSSLRMQSIKSAVCWMIRNTKPFRFAFRLNFLKASNVCDLRYLVAFIGAILRSIKVPSVFRIWKPGMFEKFNCGNEWILHRQYHWACAQNYLPFDRKILISGCAFKLNSWFCLFQQQQYTISVDILPNIEKNVIRNSFCFDLDRQQWLPSTIFPAKKKTFLRTIISVSRNTWTRFVWHFISSTMQSNGIDIRGMKAGRENWQIKWETQILHESEITEQGATMATIKYKQDYKLLLHSLARSFDNKSRVR